MHFTAALVAGFAAATSAFLVVPNIPGEIKDTGYHGGPPEHFKEFIHHILEQKTTVIDLACPGCPYAVSQNEREENGIAVKTIGWEQDIENVIHLEFDTHDHSFNVNGHALLPQAKFDVIKAHQIRIDNNEESIEVPLNFAMEVMPPIPSPHKEGVSLIPVEFTVLGINGVPVKVNTISLKLIKPPSGDLVIVRAEEIPFEDTPGAETCDNASTWSICRIKAMIIARVKSIMEASKDKAEKMQGWVKEKTSGCGKGRRPHGFWRHPHPHADGEHPHPHHWDGHHGHHGHHGPHRMGHMLHQTFRLFVIPALLGIAGGLAASAIGMLVGQAIVLIWVRAYRSGRRGPLRVVEREVVVENDEKNELLGEQNEALPVYEDAPRYDEAVMRDVEAEAVRSDDEKQ